ncbi:hypothetical protein ACA910_008830 [Epithemia clementina (nom. ined.)]
MIPDTTTDDNDTNNNYKTTKVLLCGGGNAIHVLTSYIGAPLKHCQVSILSLFPGEAQRLRDAIPPESGIACINDLTDEPVVGRPTLITDDPAEAAAAAEAPVDVVILALPSFTHETYLRALQPYLQPGVILGAMPGEGGFDLCARFVLGDDFCNQSHLFALETLPWACRIVEYGKTVEVLGTKKEIDVVISSSPEKENTSSDDAVVVLALLQQLVGPLPKLMPASNFLAVTLMNINSVWHPTISYAFYQNRDVTIPLDEPPLFYQGASEYTGELLSQISDEVLALGRVLQERYPGLDLSSLHHVRDWMLRSYGNDISDTTNIYTMLLTNKGYRGLTHPMRAVPDETDATKTKYLPNFQYRYFSEDIPCGLVVTRGIAALANVPTPYMDQVIFWCQNCMGKEYLTADGRLAGRDLHETRCPQRYGIFDLETFMVKNRYVDAVAASSST